MPQDSVGAAEGDSCEYNQGGKDCYMPQDSVGAEDGDHSVYNHGGMVWYMLHALRIVTVVSITEAGRTVSCLRTA